MKKENNKSSFGKLGLFLSILSAISLTYGIFATFSFIFVILFYIFIALAIVCTFFLILFSSGFQNLLENSDSASNISNTLLQTAPYAIITTYSLSLLSTLILFFSKSYPKRKFGLIFNLIIIVLCTILLFFNLAEPIVVV